MQKLSEKIQTKIIAKKKVNSNDHEIMKFNKIYKLIITLFQIEKHYQKLEKFKSVNVMKELIYQHKMLLKTNSIVMRADETLSNAQKAESDHQKKEKKNEVSKKKEILKTQSVNFMTMMIDNLIKKMKALVLQILTMSEAVTNQMRVSVL